jgi:hypothetical protein
LYELQNEEYAKEIKQANFIYEEARIWIYMK